MKKVLFLAFGVASVAGLIGWAGASPKTAFAADKKPDPGYIENFHEKSYGQPLGKIQLNQYEAGKLHYPIPFEDKAGSRKWALAEGVVVVLYENNDGNGHQFVMWGNNELQDMGRSSFWRAASSFRWLDYRK